MQIPAFRLRCTNIDVEGTAKRNQKRKGHVIEKIQKVFFLEERTATRINGMIGVNVRENTDVIDFDNDGRSSSGRPGRKRTKTFWSWCI